MRSLIIRNTLWFLGLVPPLGMAHTTNMTTVTMKLAETGAFELTVEFDPGEKLLGYPRYYEISRLEEPARTAALAGLTQQLERELRLSFDGGRTLLQVSGWTLPNAPYETFVDTTTPTMSQAHFKGSAPPRAERLDFSYTSAVALPTPLLFRVDKAGERLPFSRVVDGPDQSMRTIILTKPQAPLLTDGELVAAASVVHGAKIWFNAYASAVAWRWAAPLVAFLLSLVLVLRGDGRLPFLAASMVMLACLLARITGVVLPSVAFVEFSLAVIAIGLGTGLAFGVGSTGLWRGAAALAGILWGLCVASWPGVMTDAVLSRAVVIGLETIGYGAAWLGLSLLGYAIFFPLRATNYYLSRVARPMGVVAALTAACWLVTLARK